MGAAGGPHTPSSIFPTEQLWRVCSVNRLLMKLAITVAVGSLFSSNPIVAQNPPPAPKAAHVEITKGPELEIARDDLAIIRWTTNNPGGHHTHLAVVHYGTDPKELSQTAKNSIRLNQTHPETIFRARLYPLQPKTTYYYTVTSMGADGKSDGVDSPVNQFTTPAPGEIINNYPQPK
jgi:Purple acid Phosphatase, N-terminal domain